MSRARYHIGGTVVREVFAHAAAGYPEEVCGLLLGSSVNLVEARRCENRQNALHAEDAATFPRDARSAYNLGPADLFYLEFNLRAARASIDPSNHHAARVVYHSHADAGAYFSREDEISAAPDGELLYPVDYLVVDVRADGVKDCKLFRFENRRFIEIEFDSSLSQSLSLLSPTSLPTPLQSAMDVIEKTQSRKDL